MQITTRWSTPADAAALARVHAEAWRFAYAGLLPGLSIERRIAARGPRWWEALHQNGGAALVVERDALLSGYATLGPSRTRRSSQAGEIYEFYLDPVCHGAGLGSRIFADARRHLSVQGYRGLIIWALAVNEVGCRFYLARGGRPAARSTTAVEGTRLEQIAFVWP